MSEATRDRLFGARHAFDHPVTTAIVVAVAAALLATPVFLRVVLRLRATDEAQRQEVWKRYRGWLILTPLLVVPVLLGAATAIAGVAVLSLLCYREYARATGLFRERVISGTVVVGILFITFAFADHWYGFFVALGRIYVGKHWPSDLLVGMAIALFVVWLCWRILPAVLGRIGLRHWVELPSDGDLPDTSR